MPLLSSHAKSVLVLSFFPQLKRMPDVDVKCIIQQLAPHNCPVYSLNKKKSSFFSKCMSIGMTAKFHITDDDLHQLDMFFVLPKNVQREQLMRVRLLKLKERIPEVSDKYKSLRLRKRLYLLNRIYCAPLPQARYPEVSVLRQCGKEKGKKLCFTEVDDIQNIIEVWVTQFTKCPLNKKDMGFFSKFLVQSVKGDVGVEKVIAIIKW